MKTKTEERIIEIRAGEGGADARIFAAQLAQAYIKTAAKLGIACAPERHPDPKNGCQTLRLHLRGAGASRFENEAGGHRLMRVPPTERQGRVHSSNVTVACLDPACGFAGPALSRRPEDFAVSWFSGTGCGGQNRNKVQACARVEHLPTGLVQTAQSRSRENSRRLATEALIALLDRQAGLEAGAAVNQKRKSQVGLGERSDRRRIWAFPRDCCEDLLTGRTLRCEDALKGNVDKLWPAA